MEQHKLFITYLYDHDFSYNHYEKTLKQLVKTHNFSNFTDCSEDDIILRHDIDFSLDAALKMARLESKLGIRSTFFILFHANLYNPFSTKSSKIIKDILNLGHYLGLHYDSSFILQNKLEPNETITKEIDIMQNHFNTRISVVVQHNPTTEKKIELSLPDEIADADDIKFKTNRKYISDSVQHWREGCFCSHINNKQLHLLIHPIWWTENNLKREQILEELLNGKLSNNKMELSEISKLHQNYLSKLRK